MLSITKLVQTTKALVNLRYIMKIMKSPLCTINLTRFHFRLAASFHTSLQVSDNVRLPTKSIEDKLGLPQRPKKPLTPYFRFLVEARPTIMKDNPQMKAIEIVQLCAKKWSTIDEATKAKLTEEYQKEKIGYIKRRSDYENSLTDEQKTSLKIVKQDLVDKSQRRVYKKVSKINSKSEFF
jgi:transcription factor A, mitochondrial